MESQAGTSSESKQITIDVPAERVAEFYAFFGRFLAGGAQRGRRGRHGHACGGGPGHQGGHCGPHGAQASPAGAGPETASV